MKLKNVYVIMMLALFLPLCCENKDNEGIDVKELYIDLVKKALCNTIHTYDICYEVEHGAFWPKDAHTMIGLKRLDNLHFCLKEVIENRIEGDFIETGVWKGGATILMRAVLKAYNEKTKKVYVADSFCGLPRPNYSKYPKEVWTKCYLSKELSVSLEEVKKNFMRYGLLDNQVHFLVGWFKDTLPIAPIEKLALLRLDGDMYESTTDALNALYSKLSIGGYIIIDDYGVQGCDQAVDDFRALHNLTEPMHKIDNSGAVFWKKER